MQHRDFISIKALSKPTVSPDFTVDDIHKIREYHAEITKEMTDEQKMSFYNGGAKDFLKNMSAGKKQNPSEAGR